MIQLSEDAIFSALRTLYCDVKGKDVVMISVSRDTETCSSDSIEVLDDEANFIQTLLETFNKVVHERVSTIRRWRNQLLPFYRFPPEILVQIINPLVNYGDEYLTAFSQQSDANVIGEHYPTLTRLCQVSSYWRNTIVACPRFWTKIDATYDTRFAERILQRSKKAPLDIMIGTLRKEDRNVKVNLNSFLAHCSRWRSFNHQMGTWGMDMEESPWMKEGAMPMLESFHVTFYPSRSPDAVRAQASKLIHLGIDCVNVPLDLGPLPSLRSVSMSPIGDSGHLTAPQWQMFLSSAPQLTNVQIISSYRSREFTLDRFDCGIYLPKLQEISFQGSPLSLCGALLGAIVSADDGCPLVSLNRLEQEIHEDTSASIYECPAFAGSILSKLREVETIRATKKESTGPRVNSWREHEEVLKIDVGVIRYRISPTFWARLLMPATGFTLLQSLELYGHQFFEGGGLLSKICLCSALQRLVIREHGTRRDVEFVSDLCSLFATPHLNQLSNQLSWPCPGLRYLELDVGFLDIHLSSLLNCIETRYGIRGIDGPNPPPVFLQELRLPFWDDIEEESNWDPIIKEAVGRFKAILRSHGTLLFE
ncbi:hypothetical protein FRC03_003939 [Tulasnella sp. 419]|nr:hypothetical protein FRC03_003939 [Tulasnella sp. 419]